MGIESDQLVYDYLSRVGDEAQQRHLPSGDRMRLVSSLRNEIDKQRGKAGGDSPAAVRRILGRLGTPDAVVRAASEGASGDDAPARAPEPRTALPEQRARRVRGARRLVIPEQASEPPAPAMPAASPPHLAGMDELGPSGRQPDWWRIETGPMSAGPGDQVPGFVGGVEIPDILKPPPKERPGRTAEGAEDADAADGAESAESVESAEDTAGDRAREPAPGAGRRRLLRLSRRRQTAEKGAGGRAGGLTHPFLLLAAALLVAGAVFGSLLALGGGWLLAYASRKLSRAEAKWAVFGLPGISAAGGLLWIWGRLDGRWGEAIPEDGMADALSSAWPVVLRTAAVASALFLVWRARRKPAG
ncbi:hypothetical protein ACFWAA_20935 [Streptomyces sp. NPDC059922]|uniref:hypothetical protein n=1 Tax=Streptomyces sp. NPDC059922 TaxID=3347005 RepID=UPI003664CF30